MVAFPEKDTETEVEFNYWVGPLGGKEMVVDEVLQKEDND